MVGRHEDVSGRLVAKGTLFFKRWLSGAWFLSSLALAVTSGLSCAAGSNEVKDPEQQALWKAGEATWTRYIERLRQGRCEEAAALAADRGLSHYSRIREAALALEQEQLLRMQPQDVVYALVLRATSTLASVRAMSARDVFVALCQAGALYTDAPPDIRVVHQRDDELYEQHKDGWWPFPALVVTPEGPRVLAAHLDIEGRHRLASSIGLDRHREVQASPLALRSEAARIVDAPGRETWWRPLYPVPASVRGAAEAKLDEEVALHNDQREDDSVAKPVMASPPHPIEGRLPAAVIAAKIREQYLATDLCYLAGLLRKPDLAGRVVVQFVIARSGRVAAAKYVTDMADEATAQCITTQLLTLRFPKPDGGIVRVTYPYQFAPDLPAGG